jgi:hypothetical protein
MHVVTTRLWPYLAGAASRNVGGILAGRFATRD